MVERKEWKWILIFACILILVTTIPYWIGFARQNDQLLFSGFLFGTEDGNSYIAKMIRGQAGDWLFRTPYTAIPQEGIASFLPYLLLGKLIAPPGMHEQAVALFQLFRWLATLFAAFVTYLFIAKFVKDQSQRRTALVLVILGGGLGWLSVFGLKGLWQDGLALEFYSPETFGFLSFLGLPHLVVSRALLLLGFYFYLNNRENDWLQGAISGLLWLLMGVFQPLTVATGWMVLAGHIGLLLLFSIKENSIKNCLSPEVRKFFIRAVATGLISSPIVIYNLWNSTFDPFFKLWTDQNIIMSPPVTDYLLAYLLILPFLFTGLVYLLKNRSPEGLLLAGWVILFPVMAYFPIHLQRRLPEGIWVAMVIISFLGIEAAPRLNRVFRFVAPASLISTVIFFLGALITVWTPAKPLYVSADLVDVLKYMNQNIKPNQTVLASYKTSNILPAWVADFVLIGHGPESIRLREIEPRVNQFFSSSDAADQKKLFDEFSVDYIIWGPDERELGSWDPALDPKLQAVYQNASTSLFKIVKPKTK